MVCLIQIFDKFCIDMTNRETYKNLIFLYLYLTALPSFLKDRDKSQCQTKDTGSENLMAYETTIWNTLK